MARYNMRRSMKPSPERFAALQGAARAARAAWEGYKRTLDRRYQSACYAPRVKVRKLEVLTRARARAEQRFYVYLKAISPRDWDRGFPCSWLIDGLGYADAITRDALSVVPPLAFQWTVEDQRPLIGRIAS